MTAPYRTYPVTCLRVYNLLWELFLWYVVERSCLELFWQHLELFRRIYD
jgi:hypothetical protein